MNMKTFLLPIYKQQMSVYQPKQAINLEFRESQ